MKFNEKLLEKEVSREIVFQGRIFQIAKCKAELCNQAIVDREIMIHSGGVCVLPVDEEGNVLLVQQYRYGAASFLLEVPAGKLEKGEEPFSCAKRELSEETGCSASKWRSLGKMHSSPAIMSEVIHIYMAEGLSYGERHLDANEFLDVVKLPFDEALAMVLSGEITDAKTQVALLKAQALLKKEN